MSVHQARKLRRTMSQPEALLWRTLRGRPGGLQFRRQHPAGPYVFDFFCRTAGLAIEVDSFAHDCGDNPERDHGRDAWASANGIGTLRIAARDVHGDLQAVVAQIVEECSRRTPPPHSVRSPSPRKRGEDELS